ncbi:MAG: RNA polymerase sigma factor [Acidimicrobiia bacterium]
MELSVRRFDDYYHLHHDRVFRALALTVNDADLAAEATDEAMARTYQHWRSVSGYANPAGWIYRVGLNWARSRFRRRRREVGGLAIDAPVWDPEPLDPAVARAIDSLPLPSRSVIVLRFFVDWSLEAIAEGLGVPVGTVKSRLHRALRRLEESLGGHP